MPHTLSIPWIIRDTTRRGKAFTNHRGTFALQPEPYIIATIIAGLKRPPYFCVNESPSHKRARVHGSTSRSYVRPIMRNKRTLSRIPPWFSARPVAVHDGENDFEYPRVSRLPRGARSFSRNGIPGVSGTVASSTIKMIKNKSLPI